MTAPIAELLAPIKQALEAGAEGALYTHWRDSNRHKENEDLAAACSSERLAALIAAVEALAAEREALQVQVRQADERGDEAMRRAHAAEAERDALRVDAERYRWLRAHRHYAILIEGFGHSYAEVEHWSNAQNEAKVDAAIDAARTQEPA